MAHHLIVIYDACVIYPSFLRDLLMRLATTDLFRAKWTDDIHKEWIKAVLKNQPDIPHAKLARVRQLMDEHVLDALVTDYESLIPRLNLPDPGDRHVLAAAVRAKADLIITFNLRDFPDEILQGHGIAACHPDDFIADLYDLDPVTVCAAARQHRTSLRNPAMTAEQYLEKLVMRALPRSAALLRMHTEAL